MYVASNSEHGGGDLMRQLNRRQFLQRGSLAVAAAGVASAIPAVGALLDDEAPAVAPEAPAAVDSAVPSMTDPVVARVTNVSSGEVQMFFGTSSSTVKDPELAARLLRAATP
jgi:hypothetical protein